ncbi:hypothetical protein GCM10011348_16120 [Marinobacterium nitratireducens]|uniref:MSHA biogenesis protein MshQ n=1 Tax=Marinobacterium nitratireducens TaxID=518897 RepID=A0A917ZCV3_9GAMM|nr:hypothetical protein [Marinobacterium nitratireducens]GGO80122.1 hypothetical protein GCM10011348_16120 [Marinobacterium nitratireducens]
MKLQKTPLRRVMSFLTLCLPLMLVMGFYSGQAQAICNATASGTVASMFEDDDGDLDLQGTCVGEGDADMDWNEFAPVTWSTEDFPAPYRTTTSSAKGWFFAGKEDDEVSNSDTAFAGGVKQDDNCPKLKNGKAPNKDDLSRVYLSSKTVDGHTLLNLAWARIPQNSDTASAHVGFEFKKGSMPCDDDPTLTKREVGDVLFVYDFEGGNEPVVLTLRRWIDENYLTDEKQNGLGDNPVAFWTDMASPCDIDSNSPPCWGDAVDLTALGFAEADVNDVGSTVFDELAPNGPEDLGSVQFGEAGIDLTAAGVFPQNTCQSFGRAFAVSRSSGNSGQAQMKDLVGPGNFTLANCGTVIVRKQTVPDEDPNSTDFTFSTSVMTNSGAVPNFTLKDDGVKTIFDVLPDSGLTVTETPSAGYDLTGIDCTAGNVVPTAASLATGTVTFDIGSSDILDCTYTNTARSAIAVVKDVVNACEDDDGEFKLYLDTDLKATGGDGASFAEDSLSPGTYEVSEQAGASTALTSYDTYITCNGTTTNAASASVSLAAGDDKDCTITNIRRPTIQVTKLVFDSSKWDLLVDDGGDGFDYEATDKGNGESTGEVVIMTIDSGVGENTLYGPVVLGEEAANSDANTTLDGVNGYAPTWDCNNSLGPVRGTGESFTIDQLRPGEEVQCTVTNAAPVAGACSPGSN